MIHTDVLILIARRAVRPDNVGCLDDATVEQEKAMILELMGAARVLRDDLDETLAELAELAAKAGATNPERGAAYGISKQAAAKRWGDPRASRVAVPK